MGGARREIIGITRPTPRTRCWPSSSQRTPRGGDLRGRWGVEAEKSGVTVG